MSREVSMVCLCLCLCLCVCVFVYLRVFLCIIVLCMLDEICNVVPLIYAVPANGNNTVLQNPGLYGGVAQVGF